MSFGETLRAAREAKGLTCSQVAAQTRLLVQIVEEMEREDFHRIAAPIYGRGFVRLYAQCVDLDPKPLVAEFMEIYEGHRAPVVRTRDVPAAEPEESAPATAPGASDEIVPPPPAPPPLPADEGTLPPDGEAASAPEAASAAPAPADVSAEPPPAVRGLDLFEQAYGTQDPLPPVAGVQRRPPSSKSAARRRERQNVDFSADDSPFLPPVAEETGPSVGERLSRGLSGVSHGFVRTVRRIPRSTWRFSVLIAAALAFVALIGFVCVKLYQFTAPQRHPAEPQIEVAASKPAARPAAAPAQSATSASPAQSAKAARPASKPAVRLAKVARHGALTVSGVKVPSLYID